MSDLSGVTRNDLEQMFQNQTDLFTNELRRVDERVSGLNERIGGFEKQIITKFEKLSHSVHEDVTVALSENKKTNKTVINHERRITKLEKIHA